jgi:D-inositol-3-phosphate glycosyltransferase
MSIASGSQLNSATHAIVSSEGRWPRICELRERPRELRVAMLCLHTSPLAALGRSRDAGGMNVYVRELARHLGRRGVSVDIFTRWTDPDQPQIVPLGTSARVIHIPAGPIMPIPKLDLFGVTQHFADSLECFAVSERLDYHVIHSHYWLSGVAGQILARRWGAPHAIMFHTLARLKQHARPEEQEPPLRGEQERRLLASADAVVVATDDERMQIARLYGIARRDLHIIPCGVDLRRFSPAGRPESRARLAASLHLGDDPVILSVGRLDPLKGPDLLLRTLAALRHRATLVVVGGHEHDPERARLASLAEGLGIARRMRFVDAVPQDALPDYYRAADLLAIASHYESFGLVAVEALACGTPVVAPAVGGLPAIVRHGFNGLLVAQRCVPSLAHQIDALLEDPDRLAALREGARPSVLRLGWTAVADSVSALYEALYESEPARAVAGAAW